jgi:glycosyltransferase involved in cell wall biosynthesis
MRMSERSRSGGGIDLSVVVPLYNEEESIRPMHAAVSEAVQPLGLTYEILFVDDGSRDRTLEIGQALTASDPHLRVVRFRRNFGQTPAMAAGIDLARGRIIVTMDGDLQNDPRDIPRFLAEIDKGYDLVVGWREKRQDKLVTRKIPSRIANWLIGRVTGVPIRDNGCSLKAYRARVIKSIPLYSEMHRFIPAMTSISGARIREIAVRHHARKFGESKYGLSRIYKVLLDLLAIKTLVAFSQRPLLWYSLFGMPFLLFGLLLLGGGSWTFVDTGVFPMPIVGTGLLLMSAAIVLGLYGSLAELLYRVGDLDLPLLAMLTRGSEQVELVED